MLCDFCGEEIEAIPYQKDGMNFCSLECSDAMESGETIPISEDVLEDPDDLEEDEDFDLIDDDDDEYDDDYEEDEEEEDEDDYDDDYYEDSDDR